MRSASDHRGFWRAVPLPTAAAKASVDMAKASKAGKRDHGGVVLRPGERKGSPRCPTSRRGDMPMVSPTERLPAPQHARCRVCEQALPQKNRKPLLPKGTASIDAPGLTELNGCLETRGRKHPLGSVTTRKAPRSGGLPRFQQCNPGSMGLKPFPYRTQLDMRSDRLQSGTLCIHSESAMQESKPSNLTSSAYEQLHEAIVNGPWLRRAAVRDPLG